jgi:single-stranded-DNA-specific exonuclease
MAEALERIRFALQSGEPIGIFGDYDTDGVTAAALLTHALRAASGGREPVAVRLPLRREGYGLSAVGVDDLAAAGVKLLIAVDCGSKDHVAVARARDRGLDVVILDHHRLSDAPPEGAIIASAQLRDDAVYRGVSAAGLSYLMATALAHSGLDTGAGPGQEPARLLDLAMIGIVADVSPLTGVNRALVRDGLRGLRQSTRPGLRALCESAGISTASLTSENISFQVAPRLNAPGRIDDPQPAYDLLMAPDMTQAQRLAARAEQANQLRKTLQERIVAEVEAQLTAHPRKLERRAFVFAGENWAPGIVGLVAAKLVERFDRPAIVLSISDGVAQGSARSVPGFDVTAALSVLSSLLTRHGGHERAAGLSLPAASVPDLEEALQEAVTRSDAPPPGPPRLAIDADLEPRRLTLESVRLLASLGPFGEGNRVPLLRIENLPIHDYSVMGRESQHLKIRTRGPAGLVEAVYWRGASRSRELVRARAVDLVGTIETNTWNGTVRVQVKVDDFRPRAG